MSRVSAPDTAASPPDRAATGVRKPVAGKAKAGAGDHSPQLDRNLNDIALRHHGSRLPESRVKLSYRERDMTVTTALTLPAGTGSGEESDVDSVPSTGSTSLIPVETTLPGRLDAWLAAHDAELVKLRRHIHAHPELSRQEFATAELVATKLRAAGLKPRMMAK